MFLRCTRGLMWIWTPSWLLFCIPGKLHKDFKLDVFRDWLTWTVPKSSRIGCKYIIIKIENDTDNHSTINLHEFEQASYCSYKLHNIPRTLLQNILVDLNITTMLRHRPCCTPARIQGWLWYFKAIFFDKFYVAANYQHLFMSHTDKSVLKNLNQYTLHEKFAMTM